MMNKYSIPILVSTLDTGGCFTVLLLYLFVCGLFLLKI